MATKSKKKDIAWFCKECGYESLTYLGKCPACNSWSTFIEQPKLTNKKEKKLSVSAVNLFNNSISTATQLKDIDGGKQENRIKTGFNELDNVLGGGIEQGSFILIGGDPGIGKSTLLLQAAGKIIDSGKQVLYASAEESLNQLKPRSLSLETPQNLMCLAETSIKNILLEVEKVKPDILIVDSYSVIF